MRKFLLLITCLFFILIHLAAQQKIPLWVNPFTGKYSIFSGQRSDSTDNCRRGVVNLSTVGPLKYKIEPADLVIFELQNRTWKGEVYPDMDNLCEPGGSMTAQLKGDYSITFCRPKSSGLAAGQSIGETWSCGGCAAHGGVVGEHEKITETGVKKYDFIVHVMDLVLPDTIRLCGKKTELIKAEGYPSGGEYEWTITGAHLTKNLVQADQLEIGYDMYVNSYGDGTVEVKYTAGNIDITKTCYIKLHERSPAEELNRIDDILKVALPLVKTKLSGLGLAWIGNITRLGPKCNVVHDAFSQIIAPMLFKEKFCHYKLGAVFDSGWLPLDAAAHIYLGITDMHGKIKYVIDPWRYGTVDRKPAPANIDDEFTPW